MTTDAWILVGVLGGALLLFASERVRPDLVGILALLAVTFAGLVAPERAFAGFSSPAVITVAAMFVLSAGLVEARVPDAIVAGIAQLGGGLRSLVVVLVLVVGVMSAFMNNIAATVILIPAATTLALRANVTASKLLIPVSFGSLLGGLVTLIGTPPNLLVSEALARAGETPFSMFDFAPTGFAVLGVGLLYLEFEGERRSATLSVPDEEVAVVELVAGPAFQFGHQTVAQVNFRARFGGVVLGVWRQGQRLSRPIRSLPIQAGDVLIARIPIDRVAALARVSLSSSVSNRCRTRRGRGWLSRCSSWRP